MTRGFKIDIPYGIVFDALVHFLVQFLNDYLFYEFHENLHQNNSDESYSCKNICAIGFCTNFMQKICKFLGNICTSDSENFS